MRVLFLTHRLPYAPNRGDRARAYHIARTLAPHVDLEIVSLAHDSGELREVDTVRALGVRASAFRTVPFVGYARGVLSLAGTRPLTHSLLDAPGLVPYLRALVNGRAPDVVLAYCSGMARFAMEPPLAGLPLVLDMVDVDSAKWASLAETSRWPLSWVYSREARTLATFEGEATRRAATTLVITSREREMLQPLAPDASINVVRNGVDLDRLRPTQSPSTAARVTFCGVMNYTPNVEGVLWFAQHVWPVVRKARPEATFTIVGADPTDAIIRLAQGDNGIQVTGTVADVRKHLWDSAISVAPLLTSRGTQNKVLEALAAGLPCVVTGTVAEGLPAEALMGCTVAEGAARFSEAVVALLAKTAAERRMLAARAALNRLSWDKQLAGLLHILEAASRRTGDL